MLGRDGRRRLEVGGLAVALIVAAVGLLYLAASSQAIGVRREMARHAAESACKKAHDEHCETLITGVRSARADEDAVDVAVWQIWLNIAGLIGLGATVLYARRAWLAAQVSADAATTALDHTRADATEQADRFDKQLEVANQSVDAAEAAAVASGQASRWMKSAAAAAHRQALVAERAMTVLERPYVFFEHAKKLEPGTGMATYPINTFRVIWKNYGKTPALVTGVRLGISREDEGEDPATMPRYEMPFGAIIGVHDPWPRGQTVITEEMIKEFNEDARPIWLCGEVTYRDLHGKDHRTWFCRFFVGLGFVLDDGCNPAFNGYD